MFGKCFPFHKWGKWSCHKWSGKVKLFWQSEWAETEEEYQIRTCERCGKTQKENIY